MNMAKILEFLKEILRQFLKKKSEIFEEISANIVERIGEKSLGDS